MQNRHLMIDIGNAKDTLESVISDLVSEIENLEQERDSMADRISELEEQVRDLQNK